MKNKIVFLIILIFQIIIVSVVTFFFYNHYFSSTSKSLSSTSMETEFIIDNDYLQKKQKIKSNADLTNLNEEFTLILEKKIDSYYQKMIDYYTISNNNDMIQTIQVARDNWKEYYLKQKDSYRNLILSAYDTGSIVPIKLSDYNLTLCRFKAIELYNLCMNLEIEVEPL